MITCPVCEHQQAQGAECETCGKIFVPGALPVAVSPLLGLEPSSLSNPRSEVPVERLVEIEPTRVAAAGALSVERISDLDLGREVSADPRTAAPSGATTCRYCQNVQAQGLFCDRCGMRLPVLPVAASGPTASEQIHWVRCRACGAPAKAGQRCGDCGQLVPEAS